jgi:1-acyl-sn-glycerol-3-phosphate acyltransferase
MSDEQALATAAAEPEATMEELLHELIAELDALLARLQALAPEYIPPPYSPRRVLAFFEEKLSQCAPEFQSDILEQLRGFLSSDLFNPEMWKGIWYLVNYTIQMQADMVKRRFTGEYETDEWGLDWEWYETLVPFFTFLYTTYWRTETTGLENIPLEGRALLVSNHSGQLPWDGAMIGAAVWNDHPAQRLTRCLYAPWFATVPVLAAVFLKMGHAVATVTNGTRLLEQDELVAVFPESTNGMGKLYKERYQLAQFGRGGFVKMALSTGAPIIPVSIVGAEEIYIALAQSPTLARLAGLPYFTFTPTFPWLGPLGLIPLPTKWFIDFGEPIPTDGYGADAAFDVLTIAQLKERVRDTVQDMVTIRLAQRRSVFRG